MTRTMVDSSTFADVPTTGDIACAYIDGNLGVATQAQFEARFPHTKFGHCYIDVNGSRPDADVRDWETGDKGGSLEQWVIDHNKHVGANTAVIYCNRATIPEVRKLTGSQILNVHYFLWVATLDGTQYKGTGVIACQDEGSAQTRGHYDRSVVYDDSFWRPTVAAKPSPPNPAIVAIQVGITTVQKELKILGFDPNGADGIWGPDTTAAYNKARAAKHF
jgi:hypothetical protein